jgi:hypothetical protein
VKQALFRPGYQGVGELRCPHFSKAIRGAVRKIFETADLGNDEVSRFLGLEGVDQHLVEEADLCGGLENAAELLMLPLGVGHVYQVVKEKVVRTAGVDVLGKHACQGGTGSMNDHPSEAADFTVDPGHVFSLSKLSAEPSRCTLPD